MSALPDPSRKRPRSRSGSSGVSGASSPKRALSDSPAPNEENERSLEEIDLAKSATPTPKDKLEKIKELKSRPLVAGDTWYIISRKWYRDWESACGGAPSKGAPSDESEVGPINNEQLAGTTEGSLMTGQLIEGMNIELLPKEAWDLLVSWYGPTAHVFPRKVIAEGFAKTLRVEFYPLQFQIHPLFETTLNTFQVTISAGETVLSLQKEILKGLNLEQNQAHQLWVVSDEIELDDDAKFECADMITHSAVLVWHTTLISQEVMSLPLGNFPLIHSGDRLFVEIPQSPGGVFQLKPNWSKQATRNHIGNSSPTITSTSTAVTLHDPQVPLFGSNTDFFTKKYGPEPPPSTNKTSIPFLPLNQRDTGKGTEGGWMGNIGNSSYGSYGTSNAMTRINQTPKPRGSIGLVNLGNTCFMNSALQCLAHVPELTEFFLSGVFVDELNPDNPLSTGGELARAYGKLLHSLFPAPGVYTASVAPREFKIKLARHAPSFTGYAQHDTQELLAFLLDGLHEDLNRVLKKPYVENPDWEGGGEKEVITLAKTFWDGYKKRNDSVIVDLFQGQYKSTLVCPECAKVSITFDPFMYLTLPIPVASRWKHDIYFVTWDLERPNYKTVIDLPRTATFRDAKALVAKWFDADPDYILAAEIFQSKFYKLMYDHTPVTDFGDADTLFFYQLPVKSGQSPTTQPAPTDPLVFPVYTVSPPRFLYSNYRNTRANNKEPWGFPFFVCVDQSEADEDKIYEAIVERYTQATRRAHELYSWHEEEEEAEEGEAEAEAEVEKVVVNGTDVPAPSTPGVDDEEMDVVVAPPAGSQMSLDSQPPASKKTEEAEGVEHVPRLVRSGPKDGLFTWSIREGNFVMKKDGEGVQSDAGRPVELFQRLEEATTNKISNDEDLLAITEADKPSLIPRPTGILRRHDGIICEWDINMQEFYFGTRGTGQESKWNETTIYVNPEQSKAMAEQLAKRKKGVSINDCLDEFVKEEKLGQADLWYCPRCKKHQQATKKFEIWKVPDVLVVHLKRFSNSRMLRDKIDVTVDFPIQGLDLTERVGERAAAKSMIARGEAPESLGVAVDHMDDPLLYDLFAVDEHMGGLGGGHYRAYAKNEDDGIWYHFDDAHVTKASAQQSVTQYAYLLFYRRRTDQPIGGDTVAKTEAAKLAKPQGVTEPDVDPSTVASSSSKTAPLDIGSSHIGSSLPEYGGSSESLPSLTASVAPPYNYLSFNQAMPYGSPTSSNDALPGRSTGAGSPWSNDDMVGNMDEWRNAMGRTSPELEDGGSYPWRDITTNGLDSENLSGISDGLEAWQGEMYEDMVSTDPMEISFASLDRDLEEIVEVKPALERREIE